MHSPHYRYICVHHYKKLGFFRRRHISVETSCNGFRVPPMRYEVRREMGSYSLCGKCSVGRGWTINCIVWPSSDVVPSASGNVHLFSTSTVLHRRKGRSLIVHYAFLRRGVSNVRNRFRDSRRVTNRIGNRFRDFQRVTNHIGNRALFLTFSLCVGSSPYF